MLLQKKMIDKEISNLKAIDTLIRQEQPFAVYRIPGEDTPRLLTQASGSVRLLYDLKDLDGARGFVIAPFRASESCPIVLIQPEQWGTAFAAWRVRGRGAGSFPVASRQGNIFRSLHGRVRSMLPDIYRSLAQQAV